MMWRGDVEVTMRPFLTQYSSNLKVRTGRFAFCVMSLKAKAEGAYWNAPDRGCATPTSLRPIGRSRRSQEAPHCRIANLPAPSHPYLAFTNKHTRRCKYSFAYAKYGKVKPRSPVRRTKFRQQQPVPHSGIWFS